VLFPRTRASSAEKRIQDISRYIEDLFNSIDYNIICIFIGLFVVAGSFLQTGIPSSLWKSLTGNLSPSSLTYMVVLCIFVTVASQLIGNVPVVYMARDQLLNDGDAWHRRYAGLLLAWVSTVAGNFTLVGSAANIIVAEKAMRYRRRPLMLTAAFHFKHCAAVTLLCIALGASILYLEVFVIYK
jgi:Na+/H+ antiporter NhaD/arsenite permease-like protein